MSTTERSEITAEPNPEERSFEDTLRPRTLDEMIGQNRLRENLSVFIRAARRRGEALDHLLFHGPPGLGKTSLARIVARELDAGFRGTSGPVLERPADLAALLSKLEPGDVLFIDEIHRMPAAVEEILYPAMEDFQIDILLGQGPSAQALRLDLPRFTLVAATTRAGMLTSPLRDRFGWSARLDYYPSSDLARVLERSARLMKTPLTPEAAQQIARRSRGTPRVANRLLRRVRDFADVRGAQGDGTPQVDDALVAYALQRLDVDEAGFDTLDRALLTTLVQKFDGGPVGLDTLAAAIGEDRGTIEDLVEPFLIQEGYLERTPRGRVATRRAFLHLGVSPPAPGRPDDAQRGLF